MKPSELSYSYTRFWQDGFYSAGAVEIDGTRLMRFRINESVCFSLPLEAARKAAAKEGRKLVLAFLTEEEAVTLPRPGWILREHGNGPDYIYLQSDLSALKGSKFQAKRNHIHRFEQLGAWRYGPLEAADALKVLEGWCAENDLDGEARLESHAIRSLLAEGWSCGGVLYQKERPVAFAMGERLDDETMLVAYEKALDVPGAYAMINREFARREGAGFKYLNRASADGHPNLVKAKESYHPVLKLRKYYAVETPCELATSADTDELVELWQEAFGDAAEGARWFFDHVDGEKLVLREAGRIVAMATLVDQHAAHAWQSLSDDATACRVTVGSYLYAVAVRKDCRGRGLGTEIVHTACALHHHGVALCPASPDLIDYYTSLGFSVSSPAERREIIPDAFTRGFYHACGVTDDTRLFCELATMTKPACPGYRVAQPMN